ncbi:hypothetical protein D9M69_542170 [compost metagenome]
MPSSRSSLRPNPCPWPMRFKWPAPWWVSSTAARSFSCSTGRSDWLGPSLDWSCPSPRAWCSRCHGANHRRFEWLQAPARPVSGTSCDRAAMPGRWSSRHACPPSPWWHVTVWASCCWSMRNGLWPELARSACWAARSRSWWGVAAAHGSCVGSGPGPCSSSALPALACRP